MSSFPSSIDSFAGFTSSETLKTASHAVQHNQEQQAIVALENKVATGASTPVASTLLRGTGTGTSAWAQANLTTDVTGTLPVANGGTGVTSSTGSGNTVLSTSPTLTTPSFGSIVNSGTLSLPTSSDTLVGRATTDTLTNKTINSPTIDSPTVTTGITLPNNSIAAANLATSAITLGYAQITSNFTTTSTSATQVTGLTVTVTIPAGGRKVKITAWASSMQQNNGLDATNISIWDGTVGSGTQLAGSGQTGGGANYNTAAFCLAVVSPSAGSKTYNVGFSTQAGTGALVAASTSPAFILVEAI